MYIRWVILDKAGQFNEFWLYAIYGRHADRVLAGTLLRYALNKIMKIIVVIAGLIIAALG